MNVEMMSSLFYYKDGKLFWKTKPNRRIKVGDEAGTLSIGRLRVQVNGKFYFVHHIIWAIVKQALPRGHIDHIDNNPLNNNISNLRDVTASQNQCNRRRQINNSSGEKNVYFHKASGKWHVRVIYNKHCHDLGFFEHLEDAKNAAKDARNKFHGEYANHK